MKSTQLRTHIATLVTLGALMACESKEDASHSDGAEAEASQRDRTDARSRSALQSYPPKVLNDDYDSFGEGGGSNMAVVFIGKNRQRQEKEREDYVHNAWLHDAVAAAALAFEKCVSNNHYYLPKDSGILMHVRAHGDEFNVALRPKQPAQNELEKCVAKRIPSDSIEIVRDAAPLKVGVLFYHGLPTSYVGRQNR